MLGLTITVSASLVGSFGASYLSPQAFWPFWFLAASFPVLACIVIVFQLYWLVVLRWPVLVPLVALIVCYTQLNRLVQFRLPEESIKTEKEISFLSYNVHLFDWFNWKSPWQKRKQILEQIQTSHPDIICLQEYFHSPAKSFITLDSIISQNGLKHFYFEKYSSKSSLTGLGMIVFSRWPIINKGKFNFENTRGNSAIWADILKENDTIRVYNLHLESNRFRRADYTFIKDVNDGDTEIEDSEGWKNIIRRLKKAANMRANQADEVANHIVKSPYPVVVCGDFNDSPCTYTYNRVSSGLKDSFLEKGIGFGQTYIGIAPAFRIDYILHSSVFEATSYETHPEELSDHHAISAVLKFSGKN